MILAGPHVDREYARGKRPGIAAHIEAAREEARREADFEVGVVSIFVGGPRSRTITLRAEEQRELLDYSARTGVRVIAHSSYTAQPWGGDPDAARYIREELRTCQAAGIGGLVVHLPKLPAARTMRYLPRLHEPLAPDVRVYLETPAVKASESYYETPEKLAGLFSQIRAAGLGGAFGVCVDTAHLWVCGVDLSTYALANDWFARLERQSAVIPPESVMIHLNDSARPLGTGPDKHERLAEGFIWRPFAADLAVSGLGAVVDYAVRHRTPLILERKPPEVLIGDYQVLRRLAETLPPEPRQ